MICKDQQRSPKKIYLKSKPTKKNNQETPPDKNKKRIHTWIAAGRAYHIPYKGYKQK